MSSSLRARPRLRRLFERFQSPAGLEGQQAQNAAERLDAARERLKAQAEPREGDEPGSQVPEEPGSQVPSD